MALTAHDLLMDADLFRRVCPDWPHAAPAPLDGPFMTATQLTDYSDEPGYAIPPAPVAALRADEEGPNR